MSSINFPDFQAVTLAVVIVQVVFRCDTCVGNPCPPASVLAREMSDGPLPMAASRLLAQYVVLRRRLNTLKITFFDQQRLELLFFGLALSARERSSFVLQ